MAEASKQPFLSGSYFYVNLMARDADNNAIELTGRFTSVSGLGMEVEYEVYTEGGSEFPRYFYKETKPQTLVLEQGVVTQSDNVAKLMEGCIQGQMIPLTGTIELRDSFNHSQRSWAIIRAFLQRYIGPELNSNQAALAVSRIELIYNGCL